jgi:hypothetical protein
MANLCQAHRVHGPTNQTIELHHIVPVAWQLMTAVADPPFPGNDPDGRGHLWDARTVALCPTGHRNAHFWIVRLMHAIAGMESDDPQAAYAKLTLRERKLAEPQIALQALLRYQPYGSLVALTAAGEWGES